MGIYRIINMWVEEVNGRYKFCDRYHGRKVCVTLDGKSAKYQRKAAQILSAKMQELKKPQMYSLADLKKAYLEWKGQNYKKQTVISTDTKLTYILEKLGEDMFVEDVTPAYYKQVMAEAPTSYNERLKFFKAMMKWGYENDYVSKNICDRLPKMKTIPQRVKNANKYLEREELNALLETMNDYWRTLTEFLVLTGMRIGEVIDLTVDDVDMENRTIDVNSTFSLIIKESSSTKTDTSNRQIYIQDELMPVLERIASIRDEFCEKTIFFPSAKGRLQYDSYRKYLREHSEKVLGRKITPHIFRHTHTALLAEAGVQLEQISRRLGHADSKITRDVYLHITEKAREKENEKLKKITLLSL